MIYNQSPDRWLEQASCNVENNLRTNSAVVQLITIFIL